MIPLLSIAQARETDARAVDTFGVSSLQLMENAGARATDLILSRMGKALSRVVVVGGVGQNGGDGWVVARQLLSLGVPVTSVLVGEASHLSGDARVNCDALTKMGHGPVAWGEQAARAVSSATLVIDAVFGTGLSREAVGVFAQAIDTMNATQGKVVALDVPSGVNADSGAILGRAVRADLTVTFAGLKRGLTQHPARALAGEVVVASIGAPAVSSDAAVLQSLDIAARLSARAADAHKSSAGHVLLIAGSPGKIGAALLCGQGALRGGAGLGTLVARDEQTQHAFDARVTELMTARVQGDVAAAAHACVTLAQDARAKACVIGPGLGRDAASVAFVHACIGALNVPMVLDADALFALGELRQPIKASSPCVLTPHPGEAARLLNTSNDAVQADRFDAALRLAQTSQQTVVLKGASTIIASPSGALRVCLRGTPALATGGTGDVLAGVLAAQLASGLPAEDAASVAVYLHAVAGELAAQADRGLLASDVADSIPRAIARIYEEIR